MVSHIWFTDLENETKTEAIRFVVETYAQAMSIASNPRWQPEETARFDSWPHEGWREGTPVTRTGVTVRTFQRLLLTGNYVTVDEVTKQTGVMISASQKGDLKALRAAIRNGADVNERFSDEKGGFTSLLHLLAYQGRADVLKILLEANANPDRKDSHGETPIKSAILGGHLELVRLLLEFGASVNDCDEDGDTPLHIALFNNKIVIARLLFSHGGDVDIQNKRGITPKQIHAYNVFLRHGK
jgi:ankyrin repeat protein